MLPPATNLGSALAYAQQGYPVIPVETRDKVPSIPDRPNRASTDIAFVVEGWRLWPDANIGLLTGDKSGLVVIDLDKKPGVDGEGSMEALEAKYGALPKTSRARTGGGGVHLYFRHPGGHISNSTGKLGPGIDVKADRGFVVAPPSVHASGGQYEWEVPLSEENLADLPEWLLRLLSEPPTPANAQVEIIPVGVRNETLFKLGSYLRGKGLSEGAILAALLEENRQKCEPMLEQEEVERIAKSCERFPKGNAKKGKGIAPVEFSAKELVEMDFPPVNWAVKPLIAEGVTILAGPPKIGKRWLALDLGLAIALGENALGGYPAEKKTALYLALEDSKRRLKERVQRLMGGAGQHQTT
ncbi:MAG: hypothetical protein C0608_11405 [Deltaproteobacteria bacterium]|nr:MAG: hypothetical protein C0608_11405 [Deltaproteobacteria bacterium]